MFRIATMPPTIHPQRVVFVQQHSVKCLTLRTHAEASVKAFTSAVPTRKFHASVLSFSGTLMLNCLETMGLHGGHMQYAYLVQICVAGLLCHKLCPMD